MESTETKTEIRTRFYPNGQKKSECHYQDGEPHGLFN